MNMHFVNNSFRENINIIKDILVVIVVGAVSSVCNRPKLRGNTYFSLFIRLWIEKYKRMSYPHCAQKKRQG